MAAKVPYDTMSTKSVRSELLLTKCCCCFSLRTGCFILGYLNLVFNTIQTLALIALTTYIGVSTHGFDHFDSNDGVSNGADYIDDDDAILRHVTKEVEDERPFLSQIGIVLAIVVIANIGWVLLNVACLVGLHKRRPGPIRVYIGFATARLMLSLAGFVYLMVTNRNTVHSAFTHTIDLALAAYFILVYYVYAIQLEKEQEIETTPVIVTNDVAFVYPSKLEKENLVNV